MSYPLSLYQWLEKQRKQKRHFILIVDRRHVSEPLVQFARMEGGSAYPLLKEEHYAGASEYGPWLLELSPGLSPEHIIPLTQAGILLSTAERPHVTQKHFASLYEASLAGETVIFEFYRSDVIAPMLEKMNDDEKSRFLRNHDIGFMFRDEWIYHAPAYQRKEPPETSTPWWAIRAHHLSQQENLPLIQANLESWLWQHYPQVMNRCMRQGVELQPLMTSAFNLPDTTLAYRVVQAALSVMQASGVVDIGNPGLLFQSVSDEEVQFALHSLLSSPFILSKEV